MMFIHTNLDSLVGVTHHSNEQVDEDDDGDEEVNEEDDLEEDEGPVSHVVAHLEILWTSEAEQTEDEQVHRLYDRHRVDA